MTVADFHARAAALFAGRAHTFTVNVRVFTDSAGNQVVSWSAFGEATTGFVSSGDRHDPEQALRDIADKLGMTLAQLGEPPGGST